MSSCLTFLRFARRVTIRVVALSVLLIPLTLLSRSSAQGPGSNPFDGTYIGDAAPGISVLSGDEKWFITISEKGKLGGTMHVDLGGFATAGSCTGTISKQAQITVSGVQGWKGAGTGGQVMFSYSGKVELAPYGDLFITLGSGKTLYWKRFTVGGEQ